MKFDTQMSFLLWQGERNFQIPKRCRIRGLLIVILHFMRNKLVTWPISVAKLPNNCVKFYLDFINVLFKEHRRFWASILNALEWIENSPNFSLFNNIIDKSITKYADRKNRMWIQNARYVLARVTVWPSKAPLLRRRLPLASNWPWKLTRCNGTMQIPASLVGGYCRVLVS